MSGNVGNGVGNTAGNIQNSRSKAKNDPYVATVANKTYRLLDVPEGEGRGVVHRYIQKSRQHRQHWQQSTQKQPSTCGFSMLPQAVAMLPPTSERQHPSPWTDIEHKEPTA